MSVTIRKIAGDLRSSRSQAFLLFAAILVGQAIMTAAFMARSVIATEIERNYALTQSPDVTIDATGVSGRDLSDVERVPGVGSVDAIATLFGRYRLPDDRAGRFRDAGKGDAHRVEDRRGRPRPRVCRWHRGRDKRRDRRTGGVLRWRRHGWLPPSGRSLP